MAGFWKYKPTQGYWTRTLSLIGAMMVVAAGAGWVWSELANVDLSFDSPLNATITVPQLTGDQTPTEAIGFQRLENVTDADNKIVAARVISVKPGSPAFNAEVKPNMRFQTVNGTAVKSADAVRSAIDKTAPGGSVSLVILDVARYGIYLQAGVALAIVLGFGGYLWYLLNKPNIVEFLIATESEMKKVAWPTRREVIGSTWLVIAGTFMLAAVLFAIDLGFTTLFQFMGVLKG